MVVLWQPIARLGDTPAWGKALGIALGWVAALFHSLAGIVLILLVALSAADWWIAVRRAELTDSYDRRISHLGRLDKAVSIFIVFCFMGVDWALEASGHWNTGAFIGTALGAWWCIDEVISLLRQKVEMGGRVPDWLLRFLKLSHVTIDQVFARRVARELPARELEEVTREVRAIERIENEQE